MSVATQSDFDKGERLYRGLVRRNRIISILRIGVPVFGLLVFLALIAQIIIANIANDYGINGLRITRDELIIDSPEYAGVMADGTQYKIVAEAASTAIAAQDIIGLDQAIIELVRPDGYVVQARADAAKYALAQQTVHVPGETRLTDSHGLQANLLNATIDWTAQELVAKDNVHVIFADGSRLTGSALKYDAQADVWDFDFVKLTIAANEAN